MKLAVIVGARPQFIKAAPLFRALKKHNGTHPAGRIKADLIHTGQHYDHQMSQVFFKEGGLPVPVADLGISGGSNSVMIGRMLEALALHFKTATPDAILVFGDTNSTIATALVAADFSIPLIHVEAGLRSGDLTMPEEQNRIVTDRLSSILACPSMSSIENLGQEDIKGVTLTRDALPEQGMSIHFGNTPLICDTGDIMLDALRYDVENLPAEKPQVVEELADTPFALCTMHRAANVDNRETLADLLAGLGLIGAEIPILLPVHPRLKERIKQFSLELPKGVVPTSPLGRNNFLAALKECTGVLTDSGGLQKEAAFLGKPCVVLRPTSEWMELVDSGACVLAGGEDASAESVAAAWGGARMRTPGPTRVYGDGKTAEHIVSILNRLTFS
ncbi:UDP-N-acetyl glucosamine 2-epimerase [Desulfovibrio sp. JC010]|uniref:UDP-N-acetyl glucosamine 2-epimerase n=1 Tax=Desulfovibrio sp. JC010 TaxID=2593641 RepID=UPI0013D7096C|nr:UDP-N-acetyl glucosamine 2-epimerase [Desulfovibrio sp. JC010]NDV27477.1 UDP-N-acetyl glucosamine 2-epimerase [Desulfovibrio sp. JC010]